MSTNIEGLARFIVQSLNETGGATVNLYGFSPADGYMVGGVTDEENIFTTSDDEETLSWVTSFIEVHSEPYMDILSNPEMFIGAWIDSQTSKLHLDVSERFETEGAAMLFARERGEIAIFNLSDQSENGEIRVH